MEFARRVEALGFDSIWVGESVTGRRLEPLGVLSHIAAATGTITVGTAALLPAIRQPVAVAQAIATIDRLSEGRLVLGVGAGYPSPATRAAFGRAGTTYTRRNALLDDTVDLWRQMWAGGPQTFRGQVIDVTDSRHRGP